MANNDIHVVPHTHGWMIQQDGAKHSNVVYDHKDDAMKAARDLAERENVRLIEYDRDGRVIERPQSA